MSKGKELIQILQNQKIQGPTKAQARRMAALRHRKLAEATAALAAGKDDLAFTLDCFAMDLEMDLAHYGFDIETGKEIR